MAEKKKKKKMNPNSLANLRNFRDMTPEETRARIEKMKATISTPEYRERQAKKRTMASILSTILNSKASRNQLEKLGVDAENYKTIADILGKDVTLNDAMLMQAVNKAILDKDINAMTFVRDTMGEKAPDKVETSVSIEDYVKTHKPKM